jgi:serine/threonine protein kinase
MITLTGQTIRGYEIVEKIGQGGNGAVYKAYQVSVEREVAIKVILPEYANHPDFSKRFENEAKLVAQLEHPHIVPLYDYWHDDTGAFLVMRYIRGGSLRAVLKQQGLSLAQTARILEHLADALSVAHEHQVIHRDLKPDNILLDERSNTYLSDFGIAKRITSTEHLTDTDAIVGTLAYLSPEQLQNKPVTPQSDIYSLGIMLYEMIEGKHPFFDVSAGMMMIKHLQEPLPRIAKEDSTLAQKLDDIIQKATAKEPQERYENVLALAESFHAAAYLSPLSLPNTTTARLQPPVAAPIVRRKTPSTPEARNRYAMLQNVRTFWIEGVLENSLQGATLLDLGLRQSTGVVDHAWDKLLRTPGVSDQTIAPGTQILDVFDKMNGKMLILGEPGSGKTTTLLELARDLLYRADMDEAHPIPVVLNLSSWGESRKPLVAWMVDELSSKYQAPMKVAQRWIETDDLLPLLDGLDEVLVEHRDACIQVINDYRQDHGFVDIVICSRIADYEAMSNRLKLNGAIVIQPLDNAQVNRYLSSLGTEMNTLRHILANDATLRELAHSPLMLNIMTLAYRGASEADLPKLGSPEAQRKHVFEVYVQRMFERRGIDGLYTLDETTRYLSWLAQKMQGFAQSVFQIEKMQPAWLTPNQLQLYNRYSGFIHLSLHAFMYGAPLLVLSPILGVPWWLFSAAFALTGITYSPPVLGSVYGTARGQIIAAGTMAIAFGITVGLTYGFARGIFVALISFISQFFGVRSAMSFNAAKGFDFRNIELVETLIFSREQLKPISGVLGVIFGIFTVLTMYISFNTVPATSSQILLGILGGSIVVGLAHFLQSGFTTGEVEQRTYPNQGIWNTLYTANRIWTGVLGQYVLLGVLGYGPVIMYSRGISLGIWLALSAGFSFWLLYGGGPVLYHLILRRVLFKSEAIPFNYARFLDYAVQLVFLRKVGGSYIFIHRYLLEYFAERELN